MADRVTYRVCGLSVSSDALIAGLRRVPPDGRCDLTISMAGHAPVDFAIDADHAVVRYASPEQDASRAPLLTVWTGHRGHLFRYGEGASFVVEQEGRDVSAHWSPPLTAADAATYLLGPVLAFVLRLRGVVPLHASAVAIGGRAVVFAGEAGAGKSSTAAALAVLGHPVLSDDIVALTIAEHGVLAVPSFPRLSVWMDAAEALCGRGALPRHSSTYPKAYLDVVDSGYRFQSSALPVAVVYVLQPRSMRTASPTRRALGPSASLLALVPHTYAAYLADATMRAHEFDVLSQLVTQVPVRTLSFADGLERLTSGCQSLAADLQGAMVG